MTPFLSEGKARVFVWWRGTVPEHDVTLLWRVASSNTTMAKAVSKRASAKKTGGAKKAHGRKRRPASFKSYISKINKDASKGKLTLSSKSVKILNSLVNDFLERLATEAAALARGAKRRTLGSREVQTAVRLTLPAELAKHAMAEGTRAVAKATSS